MPLLSNASAPKHTNTEEERKEAKVRSKKLKKRVKEKMNKIFKKLV